MVRFRLVEEDHIRGVAALLSCAQLVQLRGSIVTIAFMAERSSAGRCAGDSLVAKAVVRFDASRLAKRSSGQRCQRRWVSAGTTAAVLACRSGFGGWPST